MDVLELLAFAKEQGASDLHLSAGSPPMIRVDGEMRRLNIPDLVADDIHYMIYDIMDDEQKKRFEEHKEIDFARQIGETARFHVNDQELAFTTGRLMCHETFRRSYTADHVCSLIRHLFEGRVAFHERDDQIAPGVSVHHIGGHTPGMQSVRVKTRRGWVVLASDACHFYENMEGAKPFPIVYHLEDMIEGWGKLQKLAESPAHVVPGHDPLVLQRYPAPKPELEGVVVRLDVAPKD